MRCGLDAVRVMVVVFGIGGDRGGGGHEGWLSGGDGRDSMVGRNNAFILIP